MLITCPRCENVGTADDFGMAMTGECYCEACGCVFVLEIPEDEEDDGGTGR